MPDDDKTTPDDQKASANPPAAALAHQPTPAVAPEDAAAADAGEDPKISVTPGNGTQEVFGSGFGPGVTLTLVVDGNTYAGQRTESDGTFRRTVPTGEVTVRNTDGKEIKAS